jgi:hypothetical protein
MKSVAEMMINALCPSLPKRTWAIAVGLVAALANPGAMSAQSFDPPGSTDTNPNAVNGAGTVTGFYRDANGGIHGFVRDKEGNITSFDAPGASLTVPTGIRPNDDIVGYFVDQNGVHGFVRDHQGDFATFDVPSVDRTGVIGVNANGEITGAACCIGSLEFPLNNLGYVRDHQGSITTFYGPLGNINPRSINASKEVSGDYIIDLANFRFECFLRSPNGDTRSIVIPGSVSTSGCVLNSSGLVAGSYCDSWGVHGFLRDDKGAYTRFDAPDAYFHGDCFSGTWPTGINDAATIIGTYFDSQFVTHGFLRTRFGEMFNLDPPGGRYTSPAAINNAGVVTGNYFGSDNRYHGFVWKPL